MADIVEIGGPFAFTASIPPTAAFTTIAQRTDGSFLVDVKFNLSKDGGNHQYGAFKYGAQKYGPDDFLFDADLDNADYSTDGGNTWNPMQAQVVDFRHTAVNPMQIDATPREFDFVWNAFWDLPDDFDGEVTFRFEFSAGASSVVITSSIILVFTVVTPEPATRIRSYGREFRLDDFLGEGPVTPWRRMATDFATARGKALIDASLRMILSTKAATTRWGGELAWDPAFGSLYWTLKHAQGDEITKDFAYAHTEFAFGFEPRVELRDVEVTYEPRGGGRQAMLVGVRYGIIAQNTPENQVFLPEPDELVVEVT